MVVFHLQLAKNNELILPRYLIIPYSLITYVGSALAVGLVTNGGEEAQSTGNTWLWGSSFKESARRIVSVIAPFLHAYRAGETSTRMILRRSRSI